MIKLNEIYTNSLGTLVLTVKVTNKGIKVFNIEYSCFEYEVEDKLVLVEDKQAVLKRYIKDCKNEIKELQEVLLTVEALSYLG